MGIQDQSPLQKQTSCQIQMEIQIRQQVPVLRWLEIQMGLQNCLQMEIQIRLEVQVENHLGLQERLENQDHWLHYQVRLEIHLEAYQVPQRLQEKRQQVLPWPLVLLITVITRTPIYSIAFEFITLTDSN